MKNKTNKPLTDMSPPPKYHSLKIPIGDFDKAVKLQLLLSDDKPQQTARKAFRKGIEIMQAELSRGKQVPA